MLPCILVRTFKQISQGTSSHPVAQSLHRTLAEQHVFATQCVRWVTGSTTAGDVQNTNKQEFISGYNDIEELKNASEWVKRVFRTENAAQEVSRVLQEKEILDKYKDMEYSLEYAIANRTVAMKRLMEHCQKFPVDKEAKALFIWTIDQRKKALRKLETISMERYYNIITELNIPALRNTQDRDIKYKSRKFKLNVPLKKKRELHEFEFDRNY